MENSYDKLTVEEIESAISWENLEELRNKFERRIEALFSDSKLYFRIFSRVKTPESLYEKIKSGKYHGERKIQDLIGVRVNFYYYDDIKIGGMILDENFENRIEWSKSSSDEEVFRPMVNNGVVRVSEKYQEFYKNSLGDGLPIDTTIEVQFRTITFEGWHEIEHDIRYKNQKSGDGKVFEDNKDLSRMLNGMLASLEVNDWSLVQLMDELSYHHYKIRNWKEMLQTKFRVTVQNNDFSDELADILSQESDDGEGPIGKKYFKCSRKYFIVQLEREMKENNYFFTYETVVYILNKYFVKNELVTEYFIRHPFRRKITKAPELLPLREIKMYEESILVPEEHGSFEDLVGDLLEWCSSKTEKILGDSPKEYHGGNLFYENSIPGCSLTISVDESVKHAECVLEHVDTQRASMVWLATGIVEGNRISGKVSYFSPSFVSLIRYSVVPSFMGKARLRK